MSLKNQYRILLPLFVLVFLFLGAPERAHAEDVSVEIDLNADMMDFYNNPQNVTVTSIGGPVNFVVTGVNGSGNYQYYLNDVELYDSTIYHGYYYVADPSRLPGYQTSNVLTFQFTASGTYKIVIYIMDMNSHAYKRKQVIMTVNDPSRPSVEAVADSVVAQCPGGSAYDRALWLHDWVLNHVTYDYSYMYVGSEAVLTRGTGICEGYARAYQLLLTKAGIANGLIEDRPDGHIWNAVNIDGAWYQVDCTWDDNGGDALATHKYFCVTDAIMTYSHPNHAAVAGYASNSMAANYMVRSGAAANWANEFTSGIQSNLDSKNTSFSLTPAQNYDRYFKMIAYTSAAYVLNVKSYSTGGKTVSLQATYTQDGAGNGSMNFTVTYPEETTTVAQTTVAKTTKETTKGTTTKETTKKQTDKGSSKDAEEKESEDEEKTTAAGKDPEQSLEDMLDPDAESGSVNDTEETEDAEAAEEAVDAETDDDVSGEAEDRNAEDGNAEVSENETVSDGNEKIAGSGENGDLAEDAAVAAEDVSGKGASGAGKILAAVMIPLAAAGAALWFILWKKRKKEDTPEE